MFLYPTLCRAVLEHVTANVTKQYDQNKAAEAKLRGLLSDYEAKLKDLDDALTEASVTVKKANKQNGLNAQAMDDLQVPTLVGSSGRSVNRAEDKSDRCASCRNGSMT